MAERVGFEPTVRFPVRSLSRRVLSTAQPPLRGRCTLNRSRAVEFPAIGHSSSGPRWSWRARAMHYTSEIASRNREGNLLSAHGEKRLEHGGGFSGQDACGDFDLMVEARIGKDFKAGADGAALGVVGAVDEARNAGLNDRA